MTEVEKVSSVQFNWVNFLFENLGYIRQQEREGNMPYALKLLCTLIFYSPRGVKDKFINKAAEILAELDGLAREGNGSSILDKHMKNSHAVRIFSVKMFYPFMRDVSSFLDARGYMERSVSVPEGRSHTMPKKEMERIYGKPK